MIRKNGWRFRQSGAWLLIPIGVLVAYMAMTGHTEIMPFGDTDGKWTRLGSTPDYVFYYIPKSRRIKDAHVVGTFVADYKSMQPSTRHPGNFYWSTMYSVAADCGSGKVADMHWTTYGAPMAGGRPVDVSSMHYGSNLSFDKADPGTVGAFEYDTLCEK